MAFCRFCGTALADNTNFCPKCGGKVLRPAAPVQTAPVPPVRPVPAQNYAPQQAPVQASPQNYAQPAPPRYDFSRIPVRYRCPNGHVFDSNEAQAVCTSCGAPLPKGGYIQLYRMGHYAGMAVGMGVYIDGVPCGMIGNKQSIRISVPFGPHKVHVTHTTTRACNDPVFNITPQAPYVWCKARFAAGGFRIQVDPAAPESMPNS